MQNDTTRARTERVAEQLAEWGYPRTADAIKRHAAVVEPGPVSAGRLADEVATIAEHVPILQGGPEPGTATRTATDAATAEGLDAVTRTDPRELAASAALDAEREQLGERSARAALEAMEARLRFERALAAFTSATAQLMSAWEDGIPDDVLGESYGDGVPSFAELAHAVAGWEATGWPVPPITAEQADKLAQLLGDDPIQEATIRRASFDECDGAGIHYPDGSVLFVRCAGHVRLFDSDGTVRKLRGQS